MKTIQQAFTGEIISLNKKEKPFKLTVIKNSKTAQIAPAKLPKTQDKIYSLSNRIHFKKVIFFIVYAPLKYDKSGQTQV